MLAPGRLIGLIRFESMLALVLVAVPVALRIADDRGSISAYHDMADPRWFFVPLTAASMMLVTNGLVRHDHHAYNAVLGVLLLGVVMFDHDGGSAAVHFAAAVAFFVSALVFAALMVTHYVAALRGMPRPTTPVAVVVVVALGALLGLVGWLAHPPVFWVESVGVWIIASHYLAHSVWEARHPDDGSEPAGVLQRLWPRVHRVVAVALSPLTRLWRRLTAEHAQAAAELRAE